MAAPRPSKTHIGNHVLRPETLMLSYGYDPALSEGAVKPPVFLTSTFVFGSAEEGRDFFDYASGRKRPPAGDVILHSQPLYGGTETLLSRTMARFGIGAVPFADGVNEAAVRAAASEARSKVKPGGRVSLILIETPANPTNTL